MTLATQAFRPGGSTGKADALKYDPWNRLVEYKDDDSGAVLQKNEYDGLGQRIVRVDAQANPDVTYDYYYNDQWQLLTEVKGSAVEAIYHWHPFYIDALAVRMRASDTHFFLQDANFNVTAAVDDSTNAVVERYSYSPYGQVTVLDANFAADADNKSDIGNTHLYTGRERDAETGLQLNRHRYYAWHLGRWVNRDPIRYWGGMNQYGYVGNGPTKWGDPFGLECAEMLCPGPWLPEPTEKSDEDRLRDLCKGDPDCLEDVEDIIEALDDTWVWPIWPNRCHAWADEFKDHLKDKGIPRGRIRHDEPLVDMWYMPGWGAHSVICIEINGTEVCFDKRLQGGPDHISFPDERHPDLIYPDDPRYNKYWEDYYEKERERERWRDRWRDNPEGIFPDWPPF